MSSEFPNVKSNMGLDMNDDIVCASEYISDRLYFVTLRSHAWLKSTSRTHFFSVDQMLEYVNFHLDFGPLNLAMLCRYCLLLNDILKAPSYASKKIVHYTVKENSKRANAAFLISSYAVIFLNRTPEEAYQPLVGDNQLPFIDFRDAGFGPSLFSLTLLDCLRGLYKAKQFGFFDFDDFDSYSYEYYERVDVGDLNWIVPGKLVAFCGPYSRDSTVNGYIHHSPETYIAYFRRHGVTSVVRLNKPCYSGSRFTDAGIDHHELFFPDGSTPSAAIMHRFIDLCERSPGAVAVHCKAGLGRTGSLICCYMMKHYRMSAAECIAWVRMCRPGSVIGHQQQWLLQQQRHLHELPLTKPPQRCLYGIYSFQQHVCTGSSMPDSGVRRQRSRHVSGKDISSKISKGVGSIRLCESDTESQDRPDSGSSDTDSQQRLLFAVEATVSDLGLSQGDQLTRIKALRQGSSRASARKGTSTAVTSRAPKTPRQNTSPGSLGNVPTGSAGAPRKCRDTAALFSLRPRDESGGLESPCWTACTTDGNVGSDLCGRRSSASSLMR